MKKVCVCGHFGFGFDLLNGQTIKTKIVTQELEKYYGKHEIFKIDTHGGVKKYFQLPVMLWRALKDCSNVIILPAHNGVKVIAPLLMILNSVFHKKIHYIVIGGWLPKLLEKRKFLTWCLAKYSGIYVETNIMKKKLEQLGLRNIYILPNCKRLSILDKDILGYVGKEPYKVCTFSRVMKEKGIENAVNVIKEINANMGRTVYKLDIYGQIDDKQKEWFDELQKEFTHEIKYCGCVPFGESVEVLKEYFALLFPTRFFTEGIPGTVIDAYAAGVPVVSSRWESFEDVIDDGITGIGYDFDDENALYRILSDTNNWKLLRKMKEKCIEKAYQFTPENALKPLINKL